ncbi:hypothetical protein Ancab_030913 [Ancistrocladus abbreviatus]
MFLASSSYIEDSLNGQNSMGNISPATKVVENHPIVVYSGKEGAAADLSMTLQNRSRAVDDGAGKEFSKEDFELGRGNMGEVWAANYGPSSGVWWPQNEAEKRPPDSGLKGHK